MNKNANSADVRRLTRATTKAQRKTLSLPQKSLMLDIRLKIYRTVEQQ